MAVHSIQTGAFSSCQINGAFSSSLSDHEIPWKGLFIHFQMFSSVNHSKTVTSYVPDVTCYRLKC